MVADHQQMEQVSNSLNNFFFYVVTTTGKILFSNTTIVKNINSEPSVGELPFQQFLSSKNHVIIEDWHRCLDLEKGSQYRFTFTTIDGQDASVVATGLGNEKAEERTILVQLTIPGDQEGPAKKTEAENLDELRLKQMEFIDHAAHDLHSPLRKVSTFIEKLVEQCGTNDDARKLASRITTNLSRMKDIIEGFTELAHANEAGMHFTVCNPENIIKEVVEEMNEEVSESGMRIDIASLPQLECDPVQMKSLFRNLLENAIKFKRKDQPGLVKIYSQPLVENEEKGLNSKRKYAKLIVEDNGIGFHPKFSETIFEPFKRVHSTAGIQGNGLGLAICRRIVKNHEGRIVAHSPGENGAGFVLILPIPEKTIENA